MINTRKELKEWLKYEKSRYNISFIDIITREQSVYIWKYVKCLRKSEYYRNKQKKYLWLLYCFWRLRRNNIGRIVGIEIRENCCDKGLLIWHGGSIVINANAKIGKNFTVHGANCIGNNGIDDNAPTVGDNVDLGYGASIIGNVVIGNNIRIGANSVVVKDCIQDNVTLAGVPGGIIYKNSV